MEKVTVILTDGTTMEVHPDTPVYWASVSGKTGMCMASTAADYTITAVFEPMRQCWTPYEPWMRDVLADDARVSWGATGTEYRETWKKCLGMSDAGQARYDTAIHPDDVPEKPTEDDPDEALADVLCVLLSDWEGFRSGQTLNVAYMLARAAREHIESERPPEADWHGLYLMESRKREKAEAERGDWRARTANGNLEIERLEADLARRGELLAWAQKDRDAAKEEAAEAHSRAIFAEQRARKAEALHAALRDDVANPDWSARKSILDRDDERGRS